MNWEAIGAIGEVGGAVAVVATLIYLTLQLRQNSALLKAQLATASRESTNQLTGLMASDREALRVFWAGIEGRDNLPLEDRRHFDALMSLYLEALLQSHQQGYQEGLDRADWMLTQPGFLAFLRDYDQLYSADFIAYLRCRIDRLNAS